MSIQSCNRSHASNDFAITFPPSAGMLPCQKTTAVPIRANITSFATQLTLRGERMNATVAPIMAVGMMLGRSPHLASCTDQPTIASIHSNSANAISSLAFGLIQMPVNHAGATPRVESSCPDAASDAVSTRSVRPNVPLAVVTSRPQFARLPSHRRRAHRSVPTRRHCRTRRGAQTVLTEPR